MGIKSGTCTSQGTATGCTVSNVYGNYYKIGNMCLVTMEVIVKNNGTSTSTHINIPCLPYKPKRHTTFNISTCEVIFKANGEDADVSVTMGAYGNSNGIYLGIWYYGRVYRVTQKELTNTSDASIVFSGIYEIA